ncbi:MAG: biotin--[acetyl-CoA-carboxylase] ligase [Bacteroidota bacterium]
MHKVFAKPLFLGKKVLFLTECHSTNDELLQLVKKNDPIEGTIVYTDYQTNGKGQRGNVWFSERGKNLLFSVLVKPTYVEVSKQFLLNVAMGLGVVKCMSRHVSKASLPCLKWPNDIYVADKKVGGILIENLVKSHLIDASVVGIGVNLNQSAFVNPMATSVKMITGSEVNSLQFLEELLIDIEFYLMKLKNRKEKELMETYYSSMYKLGEVANYKDEIGSFEGIIRGVDNHGRLIIEKDGVNCTYSIKEVEFLGD